MCCYNRPWWTVVQCGCPLYIKSLEPHQVRLHQSTFKWCGTHRTTPPPPTSHITCATAGRTYFLMCLCVCVCVCWLQPKPRNSTSLVTQHIWHIWHVRRRQWGPCTHGGKGMLHLDPWTSPKITHPPTPRTALTQWGGGRQWAEPTAADNRVSLSTAECLPTVGLCLWTV